MKAMRNKGTEDLLKRIELSPSSELEKRMKALWAEATRKEALSRESAGATYRREPRRYWLSRRRVLRVGTPIATVCLALLAGWYLTSGRGFMPSAYAELMQAARSSQAAEWMHISGTEAGQQVEMWQSLRPFRAFAKRGDQVNALDIEARREYNYDPATNTLTISYVADALPPEVLQASSFLAAMMMQLERAQEEGQHQMTKERVVLDGKEFEVYTITVNNEHSTRATVTVDPSAQRLVRMTSQAVPGPDGAGARDVAFDYPESGPADVYALGVPRDAKVVMRMPTESVLELHEKVEQARSRFAPTYYAVIGVGDARADGSGWLNNLTVIRKRDGRYRIEYYTGRLGTRPTPFPPEDPADLEAYVGGLTLNEIRFVGPSPDSPGVSMRLDANGRLKRSKYRESKILMGHTVEYLTWSWPVSRKSAVILPPEDTPGEHLIGTEYTTQGWVQKDGNIGGFPSRIRRCWDRQHDYALVVMESLSDARAPWQEDANWLEGADSDKIAQRWLSAAPRIDSYRGLITTKITDYGRTTNGQWYARKILEESESNASAGGRYLTDVYMDTEREIPDRLLDPANVTPDVFEAARGRTPLQ